MVRIEHDKEVFEQRPAAFKNDPHNAPIFNSRHRRLKLSEIEESTLNPPGDGSRAGPIHIT